MKKSAVSVALLLTTLVASTAAFAARHQYQVVAEATGHTVEEAIDYAWYKADHECYLDWGMSDQDITVLETGVDPVTGYPSAKVSLGCTVDD